MTDLPSPAPRGDESFTPPTPEQLEAHLDDHRSTPPSPWRQRAPLLALAGLVLLALVIPHPAALVIPWVALAPSKLMIPLSYAAILGGTCTLIGTSTNLVVNGLLLEQMPQDHPGGYHVRLQRAIALLKNDRLADADDDLRRLGSKLEQWSGSPLTATWHFAELLQMVHTARFQDAVDESDVAVETED